MRTGTGIEVHIVTYRHMSRSGGVEEARGLLPASRSNQATAASEDRECTGGRESRAICSCSKKMQKPTENAAAVGVSQKRGECFSQEPIPGAMLQCPAFARSIVLAWRLWYVSGIEVAITVARRSPRLLLAGTGILAGPIAYQYLVKLSESKNYLP